MHINADWTEWRCVQLCEFAHRHHKCTPFEPKGIRKSLILTGESVDERMSFRFPFLCSLVDIFHFAEGDGVDGFSGGAKDVFDGLKAAGEFGVGFAKSFFGVESPAAADVGEHEQGISEL
jgi:hypothetical protein